QEAADMVCLHTRGRFEARRSRIATSYHGRRGVNILVCEPHPQGAGKQECLPHVSRHERRIRYRLQPLRYSRRMKRLASEMLVTSSLSEFHSTRLPTRMATLPRSTISVKGPA